MIPLKKISDRNFLVSGMLILVYTVLCLVNMRHFLAGRFWAEEGRDFYVQLMDAHWVSLFTHLHHSHLELLTNGIVYVSTLVPLVYAPLITTYTSFFFQALPVLILIYFRSHLQLHPLPLVGLLMILAGMPQANEVLANSINLHFHMAFLAAIVLILPALNKSNLWLQRLLLILAGTSGIPTIFLLPCFLLKAYIQRNREATIQSVIMLICTLLQACLLMQDVAGTFNRGLSVDPVTIVLAAFAQQLLAPLYIFSSFAPWIHSNLGNLAVVYPIAIVGSSCFIVLLRWTWQHGPIYIRYLTIAWFSMVLMSTVTAIGPTASLITDGFGSGRYFFAPNAILYFIVAATVSRHLFYRSENGDDIVAIGVKAMAVFGLIVIVACLYFGKKYVTSGPSWVGSLQITKDACSNRVDIWPAGWSMRFRKTVCEERW
ncbi:hypothetical protein [Ketobacter sp.]